MEIQEVEGADDLQRADPVLFQFPGFNFKPSDVDLVAFYLRRRISGGMTPSNLVRDLDIYSTEPWNLPGGLFQSESEKYMFFFTRRHPISARSRKFNRTAGCGLWHGSSKDKNVIHGSQVIGYRLQFTFKKIDAGNQKIPTNWIMHEFRLNKTTNIDSLVLCKIFKRKHGEEGETDGLGAGIALSDVCDGEEEKERFAKRRRIVESGGQKFLMDGYAETSSKNASSSLSSSSLHHEAPSVAVEKPIQRQEQTTTYESLEKRRQVEKQTQQEAYMADNSEKRYCRVDNTKAADQPLVFKDEFASLEDLICLDDFPQWTTEFNASPLVGDCDETPFLPYEEQTATEERLEMGKQVEEPDQQQGVLAHYNEDTTEANSQSSLFNAVYESLFFDDSSPQDAKIDASSSFFPCSDDLQNLGWAGLYHSLMK
ncbi:uncharacterized protein A4U43_C02F12900 [Asparagus officinalis]|uniref:NAC domain-containing protein n=1 Tax=Asparagus officinalis TaxID=4686 RepID=A0A5P1FI34_ASPOF|nr:NAC domain-containing protein 19-like [Asparagus officinalis]ONK77976.1 uncharacterized protein A4U43_C02F12900 [Asparagus officinalis]